MQMPSDEQIVDGLSAAGLSPDGWSHGTAEWLHDYGGSALQEAFRAGWRAALEKFPGARTGPDRRAD